MHTIVQTKTFTKHFFMLSAGDDMNAAFDYGSGRTFKSCEFVKVATCTARPDTAAIPVLYLDSTVTLR